MSTTADICPFCLRHEGYSATRAQGICFCPVCGSDWRTLETDPAEISWRQDSVVLPLPGGVPTGEGAWRETGPVPTLGDASARALAAGALRSTPAPASSPGWDDAPLGGAALFPDEGVTIGHGASDFPSLFGDPLPPEPAEPPPPPDATTWALVLLACAFVLVVIGVVVAFNQDPSETASSPRRPEPSEPTPEMPATAAPPSEAVSAASSEPSPPAEPELPPLPSPRASPERKSAAVKEHIERALVGQAESVQAEVGVRVDDGIAYLIGTVDSATTRELVSTAAGQAFGIRAVDARGVAVERRLPPTHIVMQGETLSALARRVYGRGGAWRRIYEMNPGIDPNLIRVGQPLSMPPAPASTP